MFLKKTDDSSLLKDTISSKAEDASHQNNLKKESEDSDFVVPDTRFKCTHCCKCCRRSVELSISEAEKICNAFPALTSKIILRFSHHFGKETLATGRNPDGCAFLQGNLCILHGVAKPFACQLFPFRFVPEEVVIGKGLKVTKNAVFESIDFKGKLFKGYIMYDRRCKGVNKENGGDIDTKKIAKMSLEYVFDILNSKESEAKNVFHKLKNDLVDEKTISSPKRLNFLYNPQG
ncbi:MAG: YkgJ family cysteine cluster protein [Candidatus Hodarchaeota archaeon]